MPQQPACRRLARFWTELPRDRCKPEVSFACLSLCRAWLRHTALVPLHAYAETLLPGSDKICTLQLLSSGPPKPCPTATDVYVLLLLLGYWTLNLLFLVGTNLYFEMIDAGDPL